MLQLYDYSRSSASFRVRLTLNYKKLDYKKIPINLLDNVQKSTEYLTINPTGLVPTLVDENGNLIWQSLAIIEYLDEIYPLNPVLPVNSLDLAYVRGLSLAIAADIHPLNNLRIKNFLKNQLGHNQDEIDLWYKHWIETGLSSLEQIITASKFYENCFCYKNMFTMADICLLPQLFNARRFNCDVSNYPTLLAIEANCKKYDYISSAYPDQQ